MERLWVFYKRSPEIVVFLLSFALMVLGIFVRELDDESTIWIILLFVLLGVFLWMALILNEIGNTRERLLYYLRREIGCECSSKYDAPRERECTCRCHIVEK